MNNILKNVCSAQKLHGAEHAGSMEHREMEERNSRYRCLKMKAAAAWALAVLLSLLSVFDGEVPYVNEIQMSLAALVLLFPGNAFYAAARKQLCAGRIGLDTLIAFGASVAFLFSLFNTFFPDYWLRVGLHPYVYYEVAVLVVAVGLTGRVFRFLPEERHGADRIARIFFPVLAGTAFWPASSSGESQAKKRLNLASQVIERLQVFCSQRRNGFAFVMPHFHHQGGDSAAD